jgi:hypothetical protein
MVRSQKKLTDEEAAALLAESFELMNSLVDLSEADELQPLGPGTIYTASVVLWLLIYQRLNKNATLENAVDYLVDNAPHLCPKNQRIAKKTLSANTSGYNAGRQRLDGEVVEWLANSVSNTIVASSAPSLGHRLAFLMDGTTTTLAPEPELRKIFPPASNQHGTGVWPVALLLVLHELESGCAMQPEVGAMFGPNAVSEVELARAAFARLPPDSIVLGDVNFGIFSVAQAAVQHQQHFLLRLSQSRFGTLCRQGTLDSQGKGWKTWAVKWKPSSKDRKTNPHLPADAVLNVLVHEVVVNPNLTLWLVTSLTESAPVLATLYGKRWEVEVDIRNIKVVLDTESIRARSEDMVHKELLTSVVAYNLVVQFRRQAARMANLPVKRLSFTGVWSTFRQFVLSHRFSEPAQWLEHYTFALGHAMKDKLPNRPGRSYPRETYPRRPKGSQFPKRSPPPNDSPGKMTK